MKLRFGIFISVMLVLAACSPTTDKPGEGQEFAHPGLTRWDPPKAPLDFAFLAPDGAPRHLSDWRGEVVVLNFWGDWCQPCKTEMPSLNALAQAERGRLQVLAVHLDRSGQESPANWLKSEGLDQIIAYHGPREELVKAARISKVPTTLILDGQGREVARYTGAASWGSGQLQLLLYHVVHKQQKAAAE